MANPRKFSEKIALHNKKQAEETAAFEAVLREVSATTQGVLGRQTCQPKPVQQLIHPDDVGCHGGSLPNVKFASNNAIDLQNALHCLEGMRQDTGRQSLIDRLQHRDRGRQLHEPNQSRQLDKRRDCSPYSLSYLSPPPDSSWRRANSDSAIHSSTLAAPVPQSYPAMNSSPPSPANGRPVEVLPTEAVRMLNAVPPYSGMRQSSSCDVPGISIQPTPDQDSGIHIPSIANNTGSLPDLSGLQFTPGGTADESAAVPAADPSYHHIGPMRSSGTQGSPGSRHRRARSGPKPLVLHSAAQPLYQGSVQPLLMRCTTGSVSDCGTPSPSPISPSLSYSPPSPGFFTDAFTAQQLPQPMSQQHQQYLVQQQFEHASLLQDNSIESLPGSFYQLLHQPPSPSVFHYSQPRCCTAAEFIPPRPASQPMQTSSNCFYSSPPQPVCSPGHYGSPVMRYLPSEPPLQFSMTPGTPDVSPQRNKIPDIILTGADELLGHQSNGRLAGGGVVDVPALPTDDLLCIDEALGILDPLALDELQILADCQVLTDPAIEDSFRYD